MQTVIVSEKYQIVIPKGVREEMHIKAGEKLVVVQKEGHIHLIPIGGLPKARGMAKGASWVGIREKHDRV